MQTLFTVSIQHHFGAGGEIDEFIYIRERDAAQEEFFSPHRDWGICG